MHAPHAGDPTRKPSSSKQVMLDFTVGHHLFLSRQPSIVNRQSKLISTIDDSPFTIDDFYDSHRRDRREGQAQPSGG
jgi:hypothetical protein